MSASPPSPCHLAIGSRNSTPASSANLATATISSQSARQRSGARLGVMPPAQLMPNTPNLYLFAPK